MKAKVLVVLGLVIAAMASLTGCIEDETVPKSDLPELNNDLALGKLVISRQVENFSFVTEYRTDYDTANWRITDSKTLFMSAYLDGAPDNITVLIEHVHIDIGLKSVKAALDGWKQDTMDDKLHTGLQLGFWITNDYPYENTFAIEGFSEHLISGWGFYSSTLGHSHISENRLTEKRLIEKGGVYGNKVQVIYDLLIKSEGEEFYHTRSVVDEFLIPVQL